MPTARLRKVLVANRGEIAIRVFRACTELQIPTVAVYAHEDRYALHRVKADEAYEIGRGRSPVEAYLDIDGLVALAAAKAVDAVHPGYGFLSESAPFARACAAAGIAFIGPRPEHLELFGDKAAARRCAVEAGLPVAPGTSAPVDDEAAALAAARNIGFPLMVKAVFGGGGRGIRLVRDETGLRAALQAARSEAAGAFGRGAVYLEAAIAGARHIEGQVLGDARGQLLHLWERDCSVQRRSQKLVEVAPAVGLDAATRGRIAAAAVRLMASVGYVSAGTVEFLLAPDGQFYFLEVNPRIQVEHTITELVTGVDLVQAQLRIAQGYGLGDPEIGLPDQAAVACRGFAIQCRVTAEDPKNGFMPDVGRILTYRSPGGFGIRLDGAGAEAGAVVSPHFDSLLVKCSAWAPTFPGAVAKMRRSLGEFRIRGLRTNLGFLLEVVGHPRFRAGQVDTGFVDRSPELLSYPAARDRGNKLLAYIAEVTVNGGGNGAAQPTRTTSDRAAAVTGAPPARGPVPSGLRPLLAREGPAAVVRRLREDPRLHITDTTFRDAHQSLLAARVRTRDLVAAARTADYLDGVFSVEMWGGATFDTALRFLRESPWNRLAALRAALPHTLLQMLLRGANAVGYANYPDGVVRAFVAAAADAGIDVFRIFDSLNWIEGMRVAIEAALETGRLVEGSLCYSGNCADPAEDLYTVEYYVGLARQLKSLGVHLIGIKDMAGLLRPAAATRLIRALRQEVGLAVHLHTHDTAGTGVATVLAAAEAGVEIADAAVASMAGGTSQPNLTAVVAALRGGPRDTGLSLDACDRAAEGWTARRAAYAAFEGPAGAGASGVYRAEMPGGQYTNLRAQAAALGMEGRWEEIVTAYQAVDRLLGRIIKVTPSSKAVGDFALFLVQQGIDPEALGESALATAAGQERVARFDFPESVVQLLGGQMGQPPRPFPPLLQAAVLKGRPPAAHRLGAVLPPIDLEAVREALSTSEGRPASAQDALTSVLYPEPYRLLRRHLEQYGDTSGLDTETFFTGMRPGDETEVDIEPGKTLVLRLTAIGAADSDGRRVLQFELNGTARAIAVVDRTIGIGGSARRTADPADPDQVASPMPGNVIRVEVERGAEVASGDPLLVLEAMKMQTVIRAPHGGQVTAVTVVNGDAVRAGDLLAVVRRRPAGEPPRGGAPAAT